MCGVQHDEVCEPWSPVVCLDNRLQSDELLSMHDIGEAAQESRVLSQVCARL